jgi:transcriptional regulator with XRE-family HTH domain
VCVTEGGSIVVRRQLGRELRAWRERSQRTLDDVAAARIASVSKVHRIEHGRTSVRPGDVRELCQLYGVGEDTMETLVDLARATRDPDWWERLDGAAAPAWFELYLRLESVASELCAFHPQLVHGLLQIEDYARGVEHAWDPPDDPTIVERYVSVRMARQRAVFDRPRPLRLRMILGEAALLTRVGSDAVMAAQHAHLQECARREHVELRVLPFAAGIHTGVRGAFSVLSFPEPDDPPVAYVETYEAARYPEASEQVRRFQRRFEQIWALTAPLEGWPT